MDCFIYEPLNDKWTIPMLVQVLVKILTLKIVLNQVINLINQNEPLCNVNFFAYAYSVNMCQ